MTLVSYLSLYLSFDLSQMLGYEEGKHITMPGFGDVKDDDGGEDDDSGW